MAQDNIIDLMYQIRDAIKDSVPENMSYFITDDWMADNVDTYKSNEAPLAIDHFISNLDDSEAAVPKHLLEQFLTAIQPLAGAYGLPKDKFEGMCARLRSNAKPE